MTLKPPVVLTLLALAGGLAACGGSRSSSSSSSTGQASASVVGNGAPTSPSGSTSPGQTKPGTKLSFGSEVSVPYQTTLKSGASGPTYTLKVVVESLKQGSLADFKGIQLDASEKAGTPDYVQVKLTNLGPTAIDTSFNDPAVELQAIDNTGNLQQSITFIGDFPPCPDATLPGKLAVGQTFSTCLTFLIPGGISKVGYTGTESYISSPVVWSGS